MEAGGLAHVGADVRGTFVVYVSGALLKALSPSLKRWARRPGCHSHLKKELLALEKDIESEPKPLSSAAHDSLSARLKEFDRNFASVRLASLISQDEADDLAMQRRSVRDLLKQNRPKKPTVTTP
jgi:hypothetical protein